MYLELRKYCNFGTKNSWHVIPTQEVKRACDTTICTLILYNNLSSSKINKFRYLMSEWESLSSWLLPAYLVTFSFNRWHEIIVDQMTVEWCSRVYGRQFPRSCN